MNNNKSPSIYQEIAEIEKAGGEAVLCTITRSTGSTPRKVGSKMLVYPDGKISGTIGGGEMESRVIAAAGEVLTTNSPTVLEYQMVDPTRGDPGVCGGSVFIYLEPVMGPDILVVFGGGHVGQAVMQLASWVGFKVILADDRQEYCDPEMVPGADEYIHCEPGELVDKIEFNRQTFVIFTTRNVLVDTAALPGILASTAPYIGVIGSRKRWQTTRKKLSEKGLKADDLNRVNSPMGLEINAETPAEIAVSILAEVLLVRNGGDGKRMAIRE